MSTIIECESIISVSALDPSLVQLVRTGTLACASEMACAEKVPVVGETIIPLDIACVGPQSERCPKHAVTASAT